MRTDQHHLCPRCPRLVLQKGFGPAIAEVVPCAGGFRPAEVPFVLDNPGAAGAKTLAIRAHPVGVAALMYWDGGALGYDVRRERWRDAADRLVGCALAGECSIGCKPLRRPCACARPLLPRRRVWAGVRAG